MESSAGARPAPGAVSSRQLRQLRRGCRHSLVPGCPGVLDAAPAPGLLGLQGVQCEQRQLPGHGIWRRRRARRGWLQQQRGRREGLGCACIAGHGGLLAPSSTCMAAARAWDTAGRAAGLAVGGGWGRVWAAGLEAQMAGKGGRGSEDHPTAPAARSVGPAAGQGGAAAGGAILLVGGPAVCPASTGLAAGSSASALPALPGSSWLRLLPCSQGRLMPPAGRAQPANCGAPAWAPPWAGWAGLRVGGLLVGAGGRRWAGRGWQAGLAGVLCGPCNPAQGSAPPRSAVKTGPQP